MKEKILLYKRWGYIAFLNNLITKGFLPLNKKIRNLIFDLQKYSFYIYSPYFEFKNNRVINIKSKYSWQSVEM